MAMIMSICRFGTGVNNGMRPLDYGVDQVANNKGEVNVPACLLIACMCKRGKD
jgi:hypothetical protein